MMEIKSQLLKQIGISQGCIDVVINDFDVSKAVEELKKSGFTDMEITKHEETSGMWRVIAER